MFILFSIVAIVTFLLLGIVIGLLNPVAVDLNLFFTSATLPLSVVMSVLLVIGMAIGGFIVFLQLLKVKWLVVSKNREIHKLSDQVIQLKKTNIEIKEQLGKEQGEANQDNNLVAIDK
jgi:uncharacterized membrane protein YciS (DUF1049 family)